MMISDVCCTRCGSRLLDRDEDEDLKCVMCGNYVTFFGKPAPSNPNLVSAIRRVRRHLGIEHGTVSGYTNYGCRCPKCKEASAVYKRSYKTEKNTSQLVEA